MKSPFVSLCFAPLLAVAFVSHARAEPEVEVTAEEAPDYIRFVEDEEKGQLQTAVARFENADGVKVDLIGAVHIADKAYYEKLNEDFKGYDALLYEMVGDPNAKEDAEAGQSAGNALRFLQNLMKNMLALDFQLDGIDYTAANFVHADMDWQTFTDRRKERGETVLGMMMKSWQHQAKQAASGKAASTPNLGEMIRILMSSDTPTAMKVVLGRQFHEAEAMMSGIEGEEGSVIVAERNKVALDVLKERIGKGEKNLGIFYGAAHLEDMAKRLTEEMGFERKGTDWNTAWDIDKTAGATPAPKGDKVPADIQGAPEAEDEPEPVEERLKKAA